MRELKPAYTYRYLPERKLHSRMRNKLCGGAIEQQDLVRLHLHERCRWIIAVSSVIICMCYLDHTNSLLSSEYATNER